MSLAFQSVAPGDDLEFAADCILDRYDWVDLEYECRQHRAKLVDGDGIVAFHQHVPAPFTDSYYEEVDLEIARCLPLTEYLEDALLGIFVFNGRTLRSFEPANHVFHQRFPRLSLRPRESRSNGQVSCDSARKKGRCT